MPKKPNPKPSTRFSLNIPTDLFDQVVELARVEDRTIGAQVVHLLRLALAARRG